MRHTLALPRHVLRQVLPPPRARIGIGSALPLAAFLLLFGAGGLLLARAGWFSFAQPAAFWWLLAGPWLWWLHQCGYSGLRGARGVVALLVRLLLLGLLVMLLAQPRAVRRNDAMSVVFALDLSMSMGRDTADQALSYVARIGAAKPPKDEVGLVMFGRNAAVELPPSVSLPLDEGISQTLAVDRSGTNLEKALSLAAAVLPEENQGRVVLISDGVQTEGSLPGLLDQLKSRQIAVDVLPLEYHYEEEVWIDRLELPRQVRAGETYEATVLLRSLRDGEGDLVLLENGHEIFREKAVAYRAGRTRLSVPIRLREPGYYEYTALIVPAKREDGSARDSVEQNNRAIGYLNLEGEGKVLMVVDPRAAGESAPDRDWRPLADALREAGRAVEVRGAYDFPDDPLSLLPYDCIALVNVPADAFVAPQFAALRQAVYDQGSGFLMVGGEQSFGPGGYRGTDVEQILPVTMDVTQKKVMPKGALVIVLHTCEFADGNTWGKDITKQAMRVLGPEDDVGVLAYTMTGQAWLFPLTAASEYNRLAVLVNNAEIGDMPDFGTTMALGLDGLKASDASVKHMVIISDGDPQAPSPDLLQQFRAAKVTVSTVAIFPHGGDVQTMQAIAGVTGGNFYFPQDPNLLPSIFVKEAKTLRKSLIQNKTFVPEVPAASVPSAVLKGIDAMPPLHGYVITTPKPQAHTVLAVPGSEDLEPVLAIWRTGVGKTAAFTSDLSTNWARDWQAWEKYKAFAKQLIIDISRVSRQGQLRLQAYAAGGTGVVVAEDFAPQASFLAVAAEVVGPSHDRQRVPLKQTGPRRYEGTFPLSGQGRYQVVAEGRGEGREERVHGGFVIAYSEEYLRFRSDPTLLRQIAGQTGGQMLDGTETAADLFGRPRIVRRHDRPVFDMFLLLLACLVPLDVGVRRVQLDWTLLGAWLGLARTHKPSDATFSRLLRAKRAVGESLRPPPEGRPPARPERGAPPPDERTAPARPAGPGADAAPPAAAPPTEAPLTTSRLLAARRQREQEPPAP